MILAPDFDPLKSGALSPSLSDFKLRACIDWIELRVTLAKASQGAPVHSRLPESWGNSYVTPLGANKRSSTVFTLRVQDPGSPDELLAQAQKLALVDIRIQAVEVALDAYPRRAEHRQDLLVFGALYMLRHQARPPTGTPRITVPGRYRAGVQQRDALGALRDGYSINTGALKAPHSSRCYVKTSDSKPGQPAHQSLADPAEHRARLEVTLRDSECPFSTLDEWRAFRFETLAEHFAMVLPVDMPSSLTGQMYDWITQLGRPADDEKRKNHRRQSRPATRRDIALNQRIRNALKALTTKSKAKPRNAEIR